MSTTYRPMFILSRQMYRSASQTGLLHVCRADLGSSRSNETSWTGDLSKLKQTENSYNKASSTSTLSGENSEADKSKAAIVEVVSHAHSKQITAFPLMTPSPLQVQYSLARSITHTCQQRNSITLSIATNPPMAVAFAERV